MAHRTVFPALFAFLSIATLVQADLVINSINSPTVVNFESTVTDVNNGAYLGTGFQPSPSSGQLDSDSWAVANNDGNLAFGGTQTSGTFARGLSNTAVTGSGIWSFDTDNNGTLGDNHALGVQPTTAMSVFNPGSITLRVLNNTGATAILWNIAYDMLAFNDENRSNIVSFSFSTDDVVYTPVPAIDFISTETGAGSPSWTTDAKAAQLAASVPDGGNLYIKWTIAFATGGSMSLYDQLALDNISVSIAAVPEPSAFLFGGIVCAACGIPTVLLRLKNAKRRNPQVV